MRRIDDVKNRKMKNVKSVEVLDKKRILDEIKKEVEAFYSSVNDEEFKQRLTEVGFEVVEGTDKGIFLDEDEFLFNADENCNHEIISASGGGIKCTKCRGWFCY